MRYQAAYLFEIQCFTLFNRKFMERQVCKNVIIAADKNLHLCSAKNSLWPNDCGVMTVT